MGAVDEEMDFTETTDEENSSEESERQPLKERKTVMPVHFSKNDRNKPIEEGGIACETKPSVETSSVRNYEKLLDKAIEDIKKGGSLKAVSLLYHISEEALYQKLVSTSLPRESELLTNFEENNLVRWILRSNENNIIVTKQNLMEKVGKMKKVLNITPIFCRSKFGKMWYEYFLKTHVEIFELEGIILPSANRRRGFTKRLKKRTCDHAAVNDRRRYKEKPSLSPQKKDVDLVSLYGIKKLSITLQDFKEIKNFDYIDEGSGRYTKIGARTENKVKSEAEVFNQNSPDNFKGFEDEAFENVRLMGKDISNILSSEKDSACETKWKKEDSRSCEECNRVYPHLTELEKHICIHRTSKEELPFTCYKCMQGFSTKSECTHHLQTNHRKKKLFKCNKCDKSFKNQPSLLSHVREHVKNLVYESHFVCYICDTKFNCKKSLEDHVFYVHLKQKKRYPCDICGQTFKRPHLMSEHRVTHGKVKPLPCPSCPRFFARKRQLRKHIAFCLSKGDSRTNNNITNKVTEDDNDEIIVID